MYKGPNSNNYWYMKCFIPSTGATVDTDTLEFLEHASSIPPISDKEALQHAVADIVFILKHLNKTVSTCYKDDNVKMTSFTYQPFLRRKWPPFAYHYPNQKNQISYNQMIQT
eukprot:953231-Ditylum_brightwellii.AAC.1